ncbi:uncharacterized protein PAE49_004762 isoform 1-T2 [Odontesthes bonariensis]|uniref:uncharacterized protein LOC142378674 n=1 Tax=Odontesthes bonariensis TaxID=219752 RepID=UPI003F58D8D0
MYSKQTEHSHRRQYSDRSSRQWDEYANRREERQDSQRDNQRESYHTYRGDGHSSTERTSRGREYSDSPKRQYGKDELSRDWSRKSPAMRQMSSPVWDDKRKRFAEDEDSDYRYRQDESQEKTYKLSPDAYSHDHKTRDFKYTPPQEDDFRYRKSSPESRHRHQRKEFAYGKRHDEAGERGFSGSYKDGDQRKQSQDCSQERTRSPYHSPKIYEQTREWTDSPTTSVYHEEFHQHRARFPVNGSSGQAFESDAITQSAAAPEKTSSKGFQRFLDVLNKGVNVDVLTKIVTQSAPRLDHQQVAPSFQENAAGRPRSPSCSERQTDQQQNSCWGETEDSHRLVPLQCHNRSVSPNRRPTSDENYPQRVDGGESLFDSGPKSPLVEKIPLTPEDEQQHKQMQDVLQAIGVDLGFEELGQMSHRIRERLYGKSDGDCGRKASGERHTRQAFNTRHRSRSSSSSRSSFSPVAGGCYLKKDSCSAQRDAPEGDQAQPPAEHGNRMSGRSFQDSEECKTHPQESTSASKVFPPYSSYAVTQAPPSPVMPTYSPANCSPLPYPALSLAPPPILPRIGPGLFLPRLPPLLHFPPVPPPNMFPPVLAQARHLFPPHLSGPHPYPQLFNLPGGNAAQALNKNQKIKTQPRPRCLQAIKKV